jgi:hypothetical protein
MATPHPEWHRPWSRRLQDMLQWWQPVASVSTVPPDIELDAPESLPSIHWITDALPTLSTPTAKSAEATGG